MSDYYVRKILTDYQVNQIRELLHDNNSCWESGFKTFGDSERHKRIKNNEIFFGPTETLNQIYDIIWSGIDNDFKFFSMVAPETTGPPTITRTVSGGRYRLHLDDPRNGDFSTTVFLSEPDTYEGGELNLKTIDGSLRFKLPAGYAVTYKSGIPHQVNPVTSGARYVSVFWTKSKFKNPNIRKLWGDIKTVCRVLEQKHGYVELPIMENIEEVEHNPHFLLSSVLDDIERDFNQHL
tara:strand:- start:188 stop:895 length:708 start_codon:yes stop_codon:yes gene_type:complete